MSVLTLGAVPDRVDVRVTAGDPVDELITARDEAGELVDFTDWDVQVRVLTAIDGSALAPPPVMTGAAAGLQVTATSEDTAVWGSWPVDCARMELTATHPDGSDVGRYRAAGWITIYS